MVLISQLTDIGPVSEARQDVKKLTLCKGIHQTHKNDSMYNNETKGNRCQSSLRKMRARSPSFGFSSSAIDFSPSKWTMLPISSNESVAMAFY